MKSQEKSVINFTLLVFFTLAFCNSSLAQTLQSGMYNNNMVNTPTRVEHAGNTISISMSDGIKKFTLKSGNMYTRSYTNPYNNSMVRYYEVVVLSTTKFSIGEVGREKQIWTYTGSAEGAIKAANNCDCENAAEVRKYFDKAMEDLQAHTCSYCAELARWQCFYACSATGYSKQEIEQKMAYYEKVLKSYQGQNSTNVTAQGGLKTEENTICCNELVGKKITYAEKNSKATSNTNAQSNSDFLNNLSQLGNNEQSSVPQDEKALVEGVLNALATPEQKENYIKQQQMEATLRGAYNELQNGQFGSSTQQITTMLAQGIPDAIAAYRQRKLALAEVEKNMPTLDKLANEPYEKKSITDDLSSLKAWNTELYLKMDKRVSEGGTTYYSYNTSNPCEIENNILTLTTENYRGAAPFFGDQYETKYTYKQYYTNPDKFDFSKDFKMSLYAKFPNLSDVKGDFFSGGLYPSLDINIGGGFVAKIKPYAREFSKKKSYWLEYITPKKYNVVENGTVKEMSGNLSEWGAYPHNGIVTTYYDDQTWEELTKIWGGIVKITIVKKGNDFICEANDRPVLKWTLKGMKERIPVEPTQVTYFPDKYFMGFYVDPNVNANSSKKQKEAATGFSIEVHKIELEHL